jgi:hypothetical protein
MGVHRGSRSPQASSLLAPCGPGQRTAQLSAMSQGRQSGWSQTARPPCHGKSKAEPCVTQMMRSLGGAGICIGSCTVVWCASQEKRDSATTIMCLANEMGFACGCSASHNADVESVAVHVQVDFVL